MPSVAERLATLTTELAQHRKELDRLPASVAALSEQLAKLQSSVEALHRDVTSLSKWRGWLMERCRSYYKALLYAIAATILHVMSGPLATFFGALAKGLLRGLG